MAPRTRTFGLMAVLMVMGLSFAPACTVGDGGDPPGDGDGDGDVGDGDGDVEEPEPAIAMIVGAADLQADLNRISSTTITISSLEGFAGDVDITIADFDAEAGALTMDPVGPYTLTDAGSVEVTLTLTTDPGSLASIQNLTVMATPVDTTVLAVGTPLDVTVNNMLEIPILDSTSPALADMSYRNTYRCDGGDAQVVDAGRDLAAGDVLSVRSDTNLYFTNFDADLGTGNESPDGHRIHAQDGIAHQPALAMANAGALGERGGSYGAVGQVGSIETIDPLNLTFDAGGNGNTPLFYCHSEGAAGDGVRIQILDPAL